MPLSRLEIKKRMVELARKYVETHDPKIIKELYKLGRELEKVEKSEKQWGAGDNSRSAPEIILSAFEPHAVGFFRRRLLEILAERQAHSAARFSIWIIEKIDDWTSTVAPPSLSKISYRLWVSSYSNIVMSSYSNTVTSLLS